jgi:hypothetical protein
MRTSAPSTAARSLPAGTRFRRHGGPGVPGSRPTSLRIVGLPALYARGRRKGKLYDVDRLMDEAERGIRPLHRSAGTPVGQLRETSWSREDAWLEFGVAAAGAAAVLAGLVFVAVSINLEKVLEVRGLPGRAGETIVMFMGALIASLLLLVPGQSRTALGVELAATGIVLAVVLILISWPGLRHQAHHPLSWRITGIVSALVTSVPIAVAGICLLAESGGGLYWLFAAVTLAFIAGIGNAWVLLVEVIRDERYRATTGPPSS